MERAGAAPHQIQGCAGIRGVKVAPATRSTWLALARDMFVRFGGPLGGDTSTLERVFSMTVLYGMGSNDRREHYLGRVRVTVVSL